MAFIIPVRSKFRNISAPQSSKVLNFRRLLSRISTQSELRKTGKGLDLCRRRKRKEKTGPCSARPLEKLIWVKEILSPCLTQTLQEEEAGSLTLWSSPTHSQLPLQTCGLSPATQQHQNQTLECHLVSAAPHCSHTKPTQWWKAQDSSSVQF